MTEVKEFSKQFSIASTSDVANPSVTIIMPVRNESKAIAKCLRSVLCQTYSEGETEVLVVDGMSDDGTRSIVENICAEQSQHSLTSQVADNRSIEPRSHVRVLDNPFRVVP